MLARQIPTEPNGKVKGIGRGNVHDRNIRIFVFRPLFPFVVFNFVASVGKLPEEFDGDLVDHDVKSRRLDGRILSY